MKKFSLAVVAFFCLSPIFAEGAPDMVAAVGNGDLSAVMDLVKKDQSLVNATDGNTAVLIQASFKGDLAMAKYLVKSGASVDCTNKGGWSPLNAAIFSGNPSLIDYFLTLPQVLKNIDKVGHNGWTPLSMAAAKGDMRTVKILVAKKARIKNDDGWQDLFKMSCYSGSREMYEYAISFYAKPELLKTESSGYTGLHYLAFGGGWFEILPSDYDPLYIADNLIEAGVDKALVGANGKTAYQIAADSGKAGNLLEKLK